MIRKPYYPIVYVRGYAGSRAEVEDAAADPYMGFNLGSTKVRQKWTGDITRHIFESPLVRLMKDYGYRDAYLDGSEISERADFPDRAIWIYRYYEPVSRDLGTGVRPEIEDYARGLADFLADVRHAYCRGDAGERSRFKVCLVAHSMGGLVVRCYLQNISGRYVPRRTDPVSGAKIDDGASVPVDKVFTYATPHRGIDFRLIGNVPGFLRFRNVENFERGRMREYLDITDDSVPVHSLDGAFPADRFFCLIGTDSRDYEAGGGLSRTAVGPLSDGLVQIRNAYVDGAPRAFVHRAHSGHYGIVNSESGYQNLVRFFFGDMKVTGKLRIDSITLPDFARRARDRGKAVRASYNVECVTRVRAADWDLHRRTVAERCAILCRYDTHIAAQQAVYLFSSFLARKFIASGSSKSMGFAVDLGIQVPMYEVDGREQRSRFIKDSYIFRDKLNLRIISGRAGTKLYYGWDSTSPSESPARAELVSDGDSWSWHTQVTTHRDPRLTATLEISGLAWNRD